MLSESIDMDIWVVQIKSLLQVLILKRNFQKNKGDTGKTAFFMIGPFGTTILFVLTLASERVVLYGYVTISIVVLSTSKLFSSF